MPLWAGANQQPAHHSAGPGVEHHAAVELPSLVGCSVTSVIQSWLGPAQRKSRWTRSWVVVRWIALALGLRRLGDPVMPRSAMITVISFLSTVWPYASASSARSPPPAVGGPRPDVDFGDDLGSQAWRMARRLGGNDRHRKKPEGATWMMRQVLSVPWPSLAKVSTIPKRPFGVPPGLCRAARWLASPWPARLPARRCGCPPAEGAVTS